MFSTPGSPAQFARRIVNALGRVPFVCASLLATFVQHPVAARWTQAVSFSSPDSAEPLPPPAPTVSTRSLESAEAGLRVHALYQEHSSSLIRQLTRGTGCRELARDLVQETFVGLLKMAPASLARIEQPEAYLRRVSTNLLRKWSKTEALGEAAKPGLELLADPLVDQVAVLESRDTLRSLEMAMSKLKPRTREIFVAHRLDGLSYAEIASRTGLSIKGVEKQMSKAIAKIDRLLDRG
jgi:RNA polymerase sigma-70 factor (ECF subfamily)